MNEIDRLKHEEQETMDQSDWYTEEEVETLKIDEYDGYEYIEPIPESEPVRPNPAPTNNRERSGWWPFLGVAAGVWALSAGLISGGSWWALFLLFPAFKNWQRVQSDRQRGRFNKQSRDALRGAMFAMLFAFMFIFNAWGGFFPLLLVGFGIFSILANRYENEPVFF